MRPGWAARAALPDFPWDRLAPYGETARAHPGGIVDLSIGTPVDPTPRLVQDALRAAADAPGYPLTVGTPALREALVAWSRRRLGADVDTRHVLPSIGSKELVALLPSLLGLEPGSEVLIPRLRGWIIVDLDERHLPFAAAARPGVLDFPDDEMLARWLAAARAALGAAGDLLGLPAPVRS